MAADGTIVQALKSFVEDYDIATWEKRDGRWICTEAKLEKQLTGHEADWRAMCLGLGDYVNKNRFKQVVLGLSGGVDSAAVAAIAADALGPERVWCVMMPSRFTGGESLGDAQDCATRIGCRYDVIAIKPAFDAFQDMLAPMFKDLPFDTTEENMQSRARALTLMAISNKFGPMVVTTGNPIPDNIITKPPSAELREDQKDSDSLPEYEVLDDILFGLIERELPVEDILARGHTPENVKRIQHLLYIAEYKRRQAPPGVKIGNKNFGKDRRYPITNGYRDEI